MERVNRIWRHPEYQELLGKLEKLEEERIFCRHDMEHFLAVARLTYIYALEEKSSLDKELIYAAALLHDIGRPMEYTEGIPHHEASGKIAERLLPLCGFSEEETARVLEAVLCHRKTSEGETELGRLLRQADKASRCCFLCGARDDCKWPEEKMNQKVGY